MAELAVELQLGPQAVVLRISLPVQESVHLAVLSPEHSVWVHWPVLQPALAPAPS